MAMAIKRWRSPGKCCKPLNNSLQLSEKRRFTCCPWYSTLCSALIYSPQVLLQPEQKSKEKRHKVLCPRSLYRLRLKIRVLNHMNCTLENSSIQISLKKPLAKQENTRTDLSLANVQQLISKIQPSSELSSLVNAWLTGHQWMLCQNFH